MGNNHQESLRRSSREDVCQTCSAQDLIEVFLLQSFINAPNPIIGVLLSQVRQDSSLDTYPFAYLNSLSLGRTSHSSFYTTFPLATILNLISGQSGTPDGLTTSRTANFALKIGTVALEQFLLPSRQTYWAQKCFHSRREQKLIAPLLIANSKPEARNFCLTLNINTSNPDKLFTLLKFAGDNPIDSAPSLSSIKLKPGFCPYVAKRLVYLRSIVIQNTSLSTIIGNCNSGFEVFVSGKSVSKITKTDDSLRLWTMNFSINNSTPESISLTFSSKKPLKWKSIRCISGSCPHLALASLSVNYVNGLSLLEEREMPFPKGSFQPNMACNNHSGRINSAIASMCYFFISNYLLALNYEKIASCMNPTI
ncbi:MAG: hypothetical protein K1X29_07470 [Bdellovibrionales bacterium]|nr:hypothetical protein [Bdellovibrionales bacterium]